MDQEKLAKILCKIPTGIFNLLYVGRRIKKDGQLLNAKAQFLCAVVDKQSVSIETETVENAREQIEKLAGTLGGDYVPLPYVEDFIIPSENGPIPARLYKPTDTGEKLPVLLGFHGGGFIRGSVNSHDGLFRRLAKMWNFAVISVDYRLAPEHKFPAAVDDAYSALRWVQEFGAQKGLDAQKIAIGGDSSGGNLAAVACHDAKKNGTPQPVMQVLIYPTTDSHFTANSHKLFSSGFFLTEERMHWYREHYLNSPLDRDNPRASPLSEEDFSDLAPAS
nr:alpha/beta hydrolase [Sneathiella glossodoripedis]